MYVRECSGESIWNGEKQKCEKTQQQSQIKTLAANYKISQLLAKKPKEQSEKEETKEEMERQKIETEKCSTMLCPSGFRCALDKDDSTQLICDPILTQSEKEKALEQLEIESRNLIHESNGHKQIQSIKSNHMSVQTQQIKDMMTKQAEIDRPQVHRTDMQKFIEEKQLQKQRQLLELMNRQGKARIQNLEIMQKEREKDLLDMQVDTRKNMVQVNKGIEEGIVNEQKNREKEQMREMIRMQKELVARNIKERQMCSGMECPSGFRCALDKDDLDLICDPVGSE